MPLKNRINVRCRDFDTKGFCERGNRCPFDHGYAHVMALDPDGEHREVNCKQ